MDGRLHNGSVINFGLEELPGAESTQAGEIIIQFAGFELSDCIARHGGRPSCLRRDKASLWGELLLPAPKFHCNEVTSTKVNNSSPHSLCLLRCGHHGRTQSREMMC